MKRRGASLILALALTLTLPTRFLGLPGGFTVVDSIWGSPRAPAKAYPGTESNLLTVILRNDFDVNVTGVTGTLRLPVGFQDIYGRNETVSFWSGEARPGDTLTLTYYVDISDDVAPGGYEAYLNVNYTTEGGARGYVEGLKAELHVDPIPEVNLSVVDYFWGSPGSPEIAVPGSRDLELTVQILNLDSYDLMSAVASVKLPDGLTGRYGEDVLRDVLGAIPAGASATAVFRGVYVSPSIAYIYMQPGKTLKLPVEFTLEYTFSLEGKLVRHSYVKTVHPTVHLTKPESLTLASAYWSYQGRPTAVTPGVQNIDLILTFVNLGEYGVSASKLKVEPPTGFTVRASTVLQPVPPGGSSTVTLTFNVSENVEPTTYVLKVEVEGVIQTGGGGAKFKTGFDIPVEVVRPDGVDANLEVASVYWGSPGNPVDAVPGAQNLPLTVELVNRGRYAAEGLTVKFGFPTGIEASELGEAVARAGLPSGGAASTSIQVDLDPSLAPGVYTVNLEAEYIVLFNGVPLRRTRSWKVNVQVVSPPTGFGYLELSSVGWGGGLPVYPGDENVTLALTLVNRAPYTVSGLHLNLTLPEGFRGETGRIVEFYDSNPIPRWSSRTVELKISVGRSVTPGSYRVEGLADYVMESGGYGVKLTEKLRFNVTVNSLAGSLDFVESLWYGVSAGPGDVGVQLIIVLRNLQIPSMRGVVGYVELPVGFTVSTTGDRTARLPAITFTSPLVSPSLLSGVIPPSIPLEVQPAGTVGLGDYVYFTIPVSIDPNVEVGTHRFKLTVSFIDSWDTLQQVALEGSLHLLGSVKIVSVKPEATEIILGKPSNRFAVKVFNNGSAPAYDVYFAFLNLPPGVTLRQQLFYIPRIDPEAYVSVETEAYANPETPYMGTLTGLALVSFRDSYGYARRYNVTFPVTVRGRIEFRILELTTLPSPAYRGADLTISGLLLNMGRETAKHVTVYIEETDVLRLGEAARQYIGNVDPDSQIPFSLEAKVEAGEGAYEVTLIVEYRDEYGGTYSENYTVGLEVGLPPQPPGLTLEERLYRIIPIAAASIFMVVVGYFIIRHVRSQRARMGGSEFSLRDEESER